MGFWLCFLTVGLSKLVIGAFQDLTDEPSLGFVVRTSKHAPIVFYRRVKSFDIVRQSSDGLSFLSKLQGPFRELPLRSKVQSRLYGLM